MTKNETSKLILVAPCTGVRTDLEGTQHFTFQYVGLYKGVMVNNVSLISDVELTVGEHYLVYVEVIDTNHNNFNAPAYMPRTFDLYGRITKATKLEE
jgi:hypothetical protein